MRKLLILLLFPLLMGCSSDDHEDEIVDEGLIGSWMSTGDENGFYIKTFMKDGIHCSHYWQGHTQNKWLLQNKTSYTIDGNTITIVNVFDPEEGAPDIYRYEIKEVGSSKSLTLYLYEIYDNKESLLGEYQKMSNKDVKDSGIRFDYD